MKGYIGGKRAIPLGTALELPLITVHCCILVIIQEIKPRFDRVQCAPSFKLDESYGPPRCELDDGGSE